MEATALKPVTHAADFEQRLPELKAYLTGRWLTDLANFSAFVFHSLPGLNWAGFYLFDGQRLRLGPFVGLPACTEILPGRGVCGTAFQKREPLLVSDVHAFPGHIACDSASRSELVLPFFCGGEAVGVLDLDSPSPGRFREIDRDGLRLWLKALEESVPEETWRAAPWK